MVKQLALALLVVVATAGCQDSGRVGPTPPVPPGIVYEGGDGSSIKQAVVIKGATEYANGIDAEYAWLAQQFPGYRFRGQALVQNDERIYDTMRISTREGVRKTIYFDITDFYGKF